MLTTGDRSENLHKAIEYYQQAQKVFTENAFPAEWAATQNNLGVAYAMLAIGNQHSGTDFPVKCVATLYNLGLAYFDLPTGNRRQNRDEATNNCQGAIQHYENALRVYTETDFPMEWAITQNNLGWTMRLLAAELSDFQLLDSAKACFEAAARGFEAVGLHEQAQEARRQARELGD